MKKIIIFASLFFVMLTSCATTEPKNHYIRSDAQVVYSDWEIFDSLSEIKNKADCIILATVIEKEESISLGYNSEDFKNYNDYITADSYTASLMALSIRTPYIIRVDRILTSNTDINESDEVYIYLLGGDYSGVKTVDNETVALNVGSSYVFFINEELFESDKYYSLVTPIQGYAEIIPSNSLLSRLRGKKIDFSTHCDNHLLDSIHSIEELYNALN